MAQEATLSIYLRDNRLPRFLNCHLTDETHSSKFPFLPHSHDDRLELLYIHSGQGRYMVNDQFYDVSEGDVVVCNAGIIHGEEATEKRGFCSYCVALSHVAFVGLPDDHLCPSNADPIIKCGHLKNELSMLYTLIHRLAADKTDPGSACASLATSLLLLVYEVSLRNAHQETKAIEVRDSTIAASVRRFLDEHFCEPLTLDDIALSLHVNKYHLTHLFTKTYEISPMQYVNKRRMGEAQTLLITTSLTVGEIASRLSINHDSHFNSMFKKMVGMTPGQFRSLFKKLNG